MQFNERLKELRSQRGLSQSEISKKSNISSRYYQELEYGHKEPTMSRLIALADYFNVSVDYLVGRTNNPNINK